MNLSELAEEIVETYKKHGWRVSRVLHSGDGNHLARVPCLEGAARVPSEYDALWFERRSRDDKDAVELRLLSANPFALFELIDRDCPEEERERTISAIERRMAEYASKSSSGNGS